MLTVDYFAEVRGERFALMDADASGVSAELIEVEPLRGGASGGRQPFSLIFAGPPAPILPQRTYRLHHRRFPELDIFLVPIGADASGVRYQAIFS